MKNILKSLSILIFFFTNLSIANQTNVYEGLSGTKISEKKQVRRYWNKKYNKKSFVFGKKPSKFLQENIHFFQKKSKILDMGMGEGRNAIFLASKGFKVTGIDISTVAISKARSFAREKKVKLKMITGSLNDHVFQDNSFDIIICIDFVDRKLIEKMIRWIKPNGLIIYEAFTTKQRSLPSHKTRNLNYFLKPQELLSLFPNSDVLKFEERDDKTEFKSSIIVKVKK